MSYKMSWETYLKITLVTSFIYYLVILTLFYGKRLLQLISGEGRFMDNSNRQTELISENSAFVGQRAENMDTDKETISVETMVARLRDEMMAFAKQLPPEQHNAGVILSGMRRIYSAYPSLQGTSLKNILAQYIKMISETYFSVTLSDDEVSSILGHE